MELSHAVLILNEGWSEQIQDLLVGWLHEALFKFPWIWPTAKRAMMTLGHLRQDYSYCCDVFNPPNHSLLTIVDNARLLQTDIITGSTRIGNAAQSIQFSCIDCVKIRTRPRPDDPHGMSISPDLGWKIETTWNWILQTMMAIKLLPTDNPRTAGVHYGTVLYTLHHLLARRENLSCIRGA